MDTLDKSVRGVSESHNFGQLLCDCVASCPLVLSATIKVVCVRLSTFACRRYRVCCGPHLSLVSRPIILLAHANARVKRAILYYM